MQVTGTGTATFNLGTIDDQKKVFEQTYTPPPGYEAKLKFKGKETIVVTLSGRARKPGTTPETCIGTSSFNFEEKKIKNK